MGNLYFVLLAGIIIYIAWSRYKKVFLKKKIGISLYIFLLGIVPLLSFFIMYIMVTASQMDFFGYILVILFTCCIFASVWIFVAFNGEYKKAELSMYIVAGVVLLIFMMLMGLIEILPNDILELYLNPLISKGNQYDIWSRPPYQLAHFVAYIVSFPYIASFVVAKGVLIFRRNNDLADIKI